MRSFSRILQYMKVVAQIKLLPTPEQATALQQTLAAANAACNQISQVAWNTGTFQKYALQKLTYGDVRETYGLSAQLTIRCIAKVSDAYKLDTRVQRTFRPHGSVAFDDRILSYRLDDQTISIWTLAGRLRIPFVAGERQMHYVHFRQGESDLMFRKGKWYLLATCDIPDPDETDVDGVLGVDLGIVNLATDSDGNTYSGEQVDHKRQWYANRRKVLQQVGTKPARRRLRKLSGKQRRFQADTNHRISKQLVATAKDSRRALALEDLTHIRQRTERTVRKLQRNRMSNWSFAQLRQFLAYKARMAGVPLVLVDAAYTSQMCCQCGHTRKQNRKSQARFCCQECGFVAHADFNAAHNIANRAAVIQPMVSSLRVETQAA